MGFVAPDAQAQGEPPCDPATPPAAKLVQGGIDAAEDDPHLPSRAVVEEAPMAIVSGTAPISAGSAQFPRRYDAAMDREAGELGALVILRRTVEAERLEEGVQM